MLKSLRCALQILRKKDNKSCPLPLNAWHCLAAAPLDFLSIRLFWNLAAIDSALPKWSRAHLVDLAVEAAMSDFIATDWPGLLLFHVAEYLLDQRDKVRTLRVIGGAEMSSVVLLEGALYQDAVHERGGAVCRASGVCDYCTVVKEVALAVFECTFVVSGPASFGHHAGIVGDEFEIRIAVVGSVGEFWPENWDLGVHVHLLVHLESRSAGAHY